MAKSHRSCNNMNCYQNELDSQQDFGISRKQEIIQASGERRKTGHNPSRAPVLTALATHVARVNLDFENHLYNAPLSSEQITATPSAGQMLSQATAAETQIINKGERFPNFKVPPATLRKRQARAKARNENFKTYDLRLSENTSQNSPYHQETPPRRDPNTLTKHRALHPSKTPPCYPARKHNRGVPRRAYRTLVISEPMAPVILQSTKLGVVVKPLDRLPYALLQNGGVHRTLEGKFVLQPGFATRSSPSIRTSLSAIIPTNENPCFGENHHLIPPYMVPPRRHNVGVFSSRSATVYGSGVETYYAKYEREHEFAVKLQRGLAGATTKLSVKDQKIATLKSKLSLQYMATSRVQKYLAHYKWLYERAQRENEQLHVQFQKREKAVEDLETLRRNER